MKRAPTESDLRKQPDFTIFFTVLILAGFGLVMVFSASFITSLESRGDAYFFLRRQAFWVILGLMGMIATANFSYWKWRKVVSILLLFNFLLLLAIYIPGVGLEINEARRWIALGGFTLQPAEFSKIVMIIFTAAFLSKKNIKMENFWNSSFIPLAFMGATFLLILDQPDLGTGLAIAAVVGIIIFAAGLPFKQLSYLALTGIPFFIYLALNEPYRMRRIFSFLDPWADPLDTGYQIIQSLYALGPGGLFGVGLGRSRQKLYYLPEPQNDFIFAIIGEELGFLGALTIMLLFFILFWRGFKTSLMAPDAFGSLLAAGVTAMIMVQALMNIGVVTGAIPVTGITLPFISAGGSSIFFAMCAMGILMNVSRYSR
ncbi:MAG: putative lipid II flippase FtsW [Bacillota bacterium]|nr:putative lipid II flippase FtsW [Bacillota bacterium]